MIIDSSHHFDIDVDVSSLLNQEEGTTLISHVWYELAVPRPGRDPRVQRKAEAMLRNTMLLCQWSARSRGTLDRRRAVRVPLLSRLHTGRRHLVSTDISLSGLRASGEPSAPVMDVEFKIPGLPFPVDARVEVMSYQESNVTPLVGLRFINLERPYVEHIASYVAAKRERLLGQAAAEPMLRAA